MWALAVDVVILDPDRIWIHRYFGIPSRKFLRILPVHGRAFSIEHTSAGISAGIDLALAWVEQDHGSAAAMKVARELVLFLRRPGGQDQFSRMLSAQQPETKSIHELQVWMMENIDRKLAVETLADRVAMSPRNFARVFLREMGTTPSRCVLQLRVEAAASSRPTKLPRRFRSPAGFRALI